MGRDGVGRNEKNGRRKTIRILRPEVDLAHFFSRLATASQRLLLLDYDGTLSPFNSRRQQSYPYPGIFELIERVAVANNSRVVIISGRTIRDLQPLIPMKNPVELWGCHGWERSGRLGSYQRPLLSPQARQGLLAAWQGLQAYGYQDYSEQKLASIALHWRGLDKEKGKRMTQRVLGHWTSLAASSGLRMRYFDGGIELKALGPDKGTVVEHILSESGPHTVAAYLGDDLTDEDAFHKLEGRGLSVLVRSHLRKTSADLWIRPPDELKNFLARWDRLN